MLKRICVFQAVAHHPIHAGVTEEDQPCQLDGLVRENKPNHKDADSQGFVVDEVIRPRADLRIEEIAEHTEIRREQKYGIPPPGKIQLGEKENAEGEHKEFFEFE